jgi:hypothetical protein
LVVRALLKWCCDNSRNAVSLIQINIASAERAITVSSDFGH